jgi:tetratricopeptide (TPR) repeat protein
MRTLAALALLGFFVQDKSQDDIVQLKDNSILVGKIVKIDDAGIKMELKPTGTVERAWKDIQPYSVYRIKAPRIDQNNAQAHFDLGDYCLANGLFANAATEFDKALELDKSMADKVSKKKTELRNEEARNKFEEAKKFAADKRFDEAAKSLHYVIEKFADTTYAADAKKEVAKIVEEIKKDNEARLKDLEEKAKARDAAKTRKVEEGEKGVIASTLEGLDDARKQWAEGLDWESKGNLTKADRAYKTADARLVAGKRNTESLLKSNDVDVLKQAKDLDKELDAWTVRNCYRLGRMWATELNYTEALVWLNKGIKIAPDDHLLNEVLLTLTQLNMRKRAAGGGY